MGWAQRKERKKDTKKEKQKRKAKRMQVNAMQHVGRRLFMYCIGREDERDED